MQKVINIKERDQTEVMVEKAKYVKDKLFQSQYSKKKKKLSQRLKLNNGENGKIRTIQKWNKTAASCRHCKGGKIGVCDGSLYAWTVAHTCNCDTDNLSASILPTAFSLPHPDITPNCTPNCQQ